MYRYYLPIILVLLSASGLQAMQVSLQQELEIRETDEWLFGQIGSMAVDANGRLYVADSGQMHIKVFGPDGMLMGRLGRKGRGPGEFREITDIAVRENLLAVLDEESHYIAFFNTETMDHTDGFTFEPVTTESGHGNPRQIMLLPRDHLAIVNIQIPSTQNVDKPRNDFVSIYTRDGKVVTDRMLERPPDEMLVRKPTERSVRVADRPYGRRSLYRAGPGGHIYYCWTDRLEITRFDASGRRMAVLSQDVHRAPASGNSDRANMLKKYMSEYQATPHETWPAVEDFLVDERDRLWVKVRSGNENNLRWVVYSLDETVAFSFTLPGDERVGAVRNDRVYTQVDGTALRRYRVE